MAVEKDAQSEDEEEEKEELPSISGKWSTPRSGSKVPQKKLKLDEDNDEDDRKKEAEKAPGKKSI